MIELKGKYNQDCKVFIDDVEPEAIAMIKEILNDEVSQGAPIRIMPDTHLGKGIVIGFTMPMTQRVNPNHIGVDIGCSVTTHKLSRPLSWGELPELDKRIRRAVPMGNNGIKPKDFSDWWVDEFLLRATANVNEFIEEWNRRFDTSKELVNVDKAYLKALCKRVGISEDVFYLSVGTLGGGNHFIEVGKSEKEGAHYLTIHSGSRNFGLSVCNFHAKKMEPTKNLPKAYKVEQKHIVRTTANKLDIPAKLAELGARYRVEKRLYLLEGDDMFNYLVDMVIAQNYAEMNHKVMTQHILKAIGDVEVMDTIHSMHNFIDPKDWIIRKGAIRSYEGERMVIPFNMRDGILLCQGRGNADWNFSAPHGAGRILARNQAKRTLSLKDFKQEMQGIFSTSVCQDTLDESPMAYKDKDTILNAIADTATVIDVVKPIFNLKG